MATMGLITLGWCLVTSLLLLLSIQCGPLFQSESLVSAVATIGLTTLECWLVTSYLLLLSTQVNHYFRDHECYNSVWSYTSCPSPPHIVDHYFRSRDRCEQWPPWVWQPWSAAWSPPSCSSPPPDVAQYCNKQTLHQQHTDQVKNFYGSS